MLFWQQHFSDHRQSSNSVSRLFKALLKLGSRLPRAEIGQFQSEHLISMKRCSDLKLFQIYPSFTTFDSRLIYHLKMDLKSNAERSSLLPDCVALRTYTAITMTQKAAHFGQAAQKEKKIELGGIPLIWADREA